MLIDASHAEETRVLVVNGNRLEDFDIEVESRRPLKGNIFLAKVTRVEPSLQAAFVDFGGNRHGFLAFSEIHPDYYQIPVADREALLAEGRVESAEAETEEPLSDHQETVETLGGDDSEEVEVRRPAAPHRRYKIQEVIKRRQILLVQAVKEERGTKGAALTTYLSLAGRYCVLMPNTDRGGGISRKISNVSDRKKLKKIVNDLGIPEGMAVIVRTAGAERSRAEIRRDYDYLLRLWNQIRELTLGSIAPALVYEDGNLIKRSIRDLYTKDIEEVVVHGEDGYRMAKDFMKILMPSHARKVQKYKNVDTPLTHNYQIDNQLEAIHSAEVHLKSGGYIVISPTEALVAIDVNSGKATKERNIEETAVKTNIEAAEEIARHLKLRDLAGLIVIDFIDMEIHRNQTKVERAVKEAMRSDRARIQIGRISPFGLLELSRQRLRPSLIETSSEPCPHCQGSGVRRSTETTAVEVLRAVEEEGVSNREGEMTVFVPTDVALYLLNRKRVSIAQLEDRFELKINLENDDTLIPPALRIERNGEVVNLDKTVSQISAAEADGVEEGNLKKRRRRRSRRKKHEEEETGVDGELETPNQAIETGDDNKNIEDIELEENDNTKRRRRGRRGGRRRRRQSEDGTDAAELVNGANSAAGSIDSNDSVKTDMSSSNSLSPVDTDHSVHETSKLEEGGEKKTEKPTRRARSHRQKKSTTISEDPSVTPKQKRRSPRKGGENTTNSKNQEGLDVAAGEPSADKKIARGRRAKSKHPIIPQKSIDSSEHQAETSSDDSQATAHLKKSASKTKTTKITNPTQQASAKTTVIQVGGDNEAKTLTNRSGWWNRD